MYHSQWNQDRFVHENFFSEKKDGFFVDVGAHDGITINNTYFFEKLGWKGICIEPIPKIYEKLIENRNCECIQGCVYNHDGEITFSVFTGHCEMLSGITSEYNQAHTNRIEKELKLYGGNRQEIKAKCFRLQSLFDERNIKYVDFLSIDTEGSELEVIKSIDFFKTKFGVILVENNGKDRKKEIRRILSDNNYILFSELGGDSVYTAKS